MNHRAIAMATVLLVATMVSAGFVVYNRYDDAPTTSTDSPRVNILEALEKVENDDILVALAVSRITSQSNGACAEGCEISATLVVSNISDEAVFVKRTSVHSGDEAVDAADLTQVQSITSVGEYGLTEDSAVGISLFGQTRDSGDAFYLTVDYSVGSEDAAEEQITLVLPKRPISQQWTPTPSPPA